MLVNTGKFISFVNVLFVMGLAGYSVTVQRPATGPAAFMFVIFFLFCALAHQIRLMDYVKFGARKKLMKAGFGGGFRASAMSTMTSSVAPEDDKDGVAPSSSTASSTQSSA